MATTSDSDRGGPASLMVAARQRERQVSSYAALLKDVKDAGLLERRRRYYAVCISTALLALGAVCLAVVLLGNSWLQLLLAAGLAVVLAQCSFLGHDAAHRQMFASFQMNELVGRVMSGLLAGLSYGWWMGKHSRHHHAPNQPGIDGDIRSKVLSFTPDDVAGRHAVMALATRRQAWLFFPLLLLEGLNLHVDSMSTLISRRHRLKRRWLEVAMIGGHWATYLTALLLWLPPGKAAAFLGVHLAVFGFYLGVSFAPNHIGMPILGKDLRLDFVQRQVLASRNVTGGSGITFLMGGLNYQIEHHLFPSMPRPNLRRAQPLVRAFCLQQEVTYTEMSLFGAYRVILRHLGQVGLRAPRPFSCPLAQELGR